MKKAPTKFNAKLRAAKKAGKLNDEFAAVVKEIAKKEGSAMKLKKESAMNLKKSATMMKKSAMMMKKAAGMKMKKK